MTDRAIRVGDLVQVVAPINCCGNASEIGKIFLVGSSENSYSRCEFCGYSSKAFEFLDASTDDDWFAPYRLKRIPPLEELEGTKTDEPLKEPA